MQKPFLLVGVVALGLISSGVALRGVGESASDSRSAVADAGPATRARPEEWPRPLKSFVEVRGDDVFESSTAGGLARGSVSVVVAKVTGVQFEAHNPVIPEAEDGIYSLTVDRVVRGEAPSSTMSLRVFSRIDGKPAVIEGQEPPIVGGRYLFFLIRHPRFPGQYEITSSKGAYPVSAAGHLVRSTSRDNAVVREINGRSVDEVAQIIAG